MPPPVPVKPSFHTPSAPTAAPLSVTAVPPQPRTYGLEAGNQTCAFASLRPLVASSSPAATTTVTRSRAASASADCIASCAVGVQNFSALPQLTDTTLGDRKSVV